MNRRSQTRAELRMWVGALTAIAAFAALCLAVVPRAEAAFDVVPDSLRVGGYAAEGGPETQAGAHPSIFSTEFSTVVRDDGFVEGYFRDVRTKLAPGYVGNPKALPTCPREVFSEGSVDANNLRCPRASQVGVAELTFQSFGVPEPFFTPIYLLEPSRGSVSQLGLIAITVPVTLDVGLDGTDYGIEVNSINTSQGLAVSKVKIDIWGVPNDPSHDDERACGELLPVGSVWPPAMPCPAQVPPAAFFTNPTRCEAPTSSVRLNSWEEPQRYVSAEYSGPAIGGCEKIQFGPDLSLTMGSVAGAPSGLTAELKFPTGDNAATGLSEGIMRTAEVTLPAGVAINASSANELGACSDAQLALGSKRAAQCPDSSKLGSVVAETPLLDHALEGSLYLRSQASGDPASGDMFRLAMVFEDPETGLVIKQPGQVRVDPRSGQVKTTFANAPEVPVSRIVLRLKSGPRAPLITPVSCGSLEARYALTAWSGQVVEGSSSLVFDKGCGPAGFTPGFEAGTTNPIAGQHSAFTLRVTRPDGQQNLASIQTTLPKGVLAKLAGVPLCGDAEAVTGACPAGSQVGTATVGAGAGSNPLYVPQPGRPGTAVYLAGPYKGAPYSLVAMVPAQAGPFDLGTVTVRNTIAVDPTTTQVSVQSDLLPQIVQGVPISYRDVRVDVTRPEFTLNPTSCDPMQVTGALTSSGGLVATVSDRFQVAGCERLKFGPKLAISLSGQVKRGGNPALKAVLTQPKGQANIGKAAVILPKGQLIDNAHINNPCTRDQFAAGACPKSSILGRARAFSPLLDEPLEGPVYFRSNGGARELPDIVADLHGQIHVELVGFIDAIESGGTSRVRTRFQNVPDAPVTKFVMQMKGGKKGLLENSVNLCRSNPRANVKMDGQNGKVHDFAVKVKRSCGK